MEICIAGPIATADLAHHLRGGGAGLPAGYAGAPLIGLLIEALLQRGHRVHALSVDYSDAAARGPWQAEGDALRFTLVRGRRRAWAFEGAHPGRAWDLFAQERRALAEAMRAAAPQLVHAHWSYEFALAALDSGLPHVVSVHDLAARVLRHAPGPYRAVRWWMSRQVLRRARCLTAVSPDVAEQIVQARPAAGPIAVVPNPVAPRALALGRVREGARAAQVAVVCHGWSRLKNGRGALRAFARLRRQRPQAELHLYGLDFGPGGAAQRWAARAGVDQAGLHWHGPRLHGELLESLAGHDVLLHPAWEESFGVVIAEAMALGLPVVAGQASGGAPWVAGPAQWLVDLHSDAAVAAALDEALGDARRHAAASAAGRARALRDFAPGVVAEAYLAQYRIACGEPA